MCSSDLKSGLGNFPGAPLGDAFAIGLPSLKSDREKIVSVPTFTIFKETQELMMSFFKNLQAGMDRFRHCGNRHSIRTSESQ